MKHVLFTHTDLDGAGCRILFEITNNDDCTVFNCENGNIDNVVNKNIGYYSIEDEIVFGDICPSLETLTKLRDDGYNVKVFDHHFTNSYASKVFESAIVQHYQSDDGLYESGTSLMWKYYVTDRSMFSGGTDGVLAHAFQNAVRSYDTYEWKETHYMPAKHLQTLFSILGMDIFCDHYKEYIKHSYTEHIIPPNDQIFVDSKLDAENRNIENFIKNDPTSKFNIGGWNGRFYYGTTGANISELANRYLEENTDVDFIAIWPAGYGSISFRTRRDDLNLGTEIAAPFGGGGHPKAAGASIEDTALKGFARIIARHIYMKNTGLISDDDDFLVNEFEE